MSRVSKILNSDGDPLVVTASAAGSRYESLPAWNARHWEASETNRLNEAHWANAPASDRSINDWITDQLSAIRARVNYELRQNGDLAGMQGTLADDVVGPDGPTLEVQSDNPAYNEAVEDLWRDWFKAPTFRPTWSGAALLRIWAQNLPKTGEILGQIATDSEADGPVKMKIRPKPARDLRSPTDGYGNPKMVMGVEFNNAELDRPSRYWMSRASGDGYSEEVEPWPADMVIHEFVPEEEKQARGYPWYTPSCQPSADLRDYDDQVQDAARLMADQACLLYTRDVNEPWASPEETLFERRTIKMAPPGWEVAQINAAQPPVQYPQYRGERQRQIARPIRMPLMIAQADASRHNYSSARFDSQGWSRFVKVVQFFLSGSSRSYGVLNRLIDLVIAEARFSTPVLRNPPPGVQYQWTWPARPHVDPLKEASAAETNLHTRKTSLTSELAAEGKSLDSHIAELKSEEEKLTAAGLVLPAYMVGGDRTSSLDPAKDDEPAKATSNGNG